MWKNKGLLAPGLWTNQAGIWKLRSEEQKREESHLRFLPRAPLLTWRWHGASRDAEIGSHNFWGTSRWEQSVAEELGSLCVEAIQHPDVRAGGGREGVTSWRFCLSTS